MKNKTTAIALALSMTCSAAAISAAANQASQPRREVVDPLKRVFHVILEENRFTACEAPDQLLAPSYLISPGASIEDSDHTSTRVVCSRSKRYGPDIPFQSLEGISDFQVLHWSERDGVPAANTRMNNNMPTMEKRQALIRTEVHIALKSQSPILRCPDMPGTRCRVEPESALVTKAEIALALEEVNTALLFKQKGIVWQEQMEAYQAGKRKQRKSLFEEFLGKLKFRS